MLRQNTHCILKSGAMFDFIQFVESIPIDDFNRQKNFFDTVQSVNEQSFKTILIKTILK